VACVASLWAKIAIMPIMLISWPAINLSALQASIHQAYSGLLHVLRSLRHLSLACQALTLMVYCQGHCAADEEPFCHPVCLLCTPASPRVVVSFKPQLAMLLLLQITDILASCILLHINIVFY
jgi:hypothetical protein